MASTLTAEMLTRLQTDDKQPKENLDSTDLKFLSEKIAQYEALPTSTFSRSTYQWDVFEVNKITNPIFKTV